MAKKKSTENTPKRKDNPNVIGLRAEVLEQPITENKIGIIIIFLLTNKTMYAIVISVTVINTKSIKTINKEKDYEEICLQRLRLCT